MQYYRRDGQREQWAATGTSWPGASAITGRQSEVTVQVPADSIAVKMNSTNVAVTVANPTSTAVAAEVSLTDTEGNQRSLTFNVAASDAEAQRVQFTYDFAPSDAGVGVEYCATITNIATP